MDTKINFSSAYHPQIDGQTESTNQVLEDMLRACALKHGGSWDKSLSFAEFSYNNSNQASLKMTPFEALYGRSAGLPCIRVRVVRASCSALKSLRRLNDKCRLFVRI
jgi:hypothetical protein